MVRKRKPEPPWCEYCGKTDGDIREAIIVLSNGRVVKPMMHVQPDDKCIDSYIDDQEALINPPQSLAQAVGKYERD